MMRKKLSVILIAVMLFGMMPGFANGASADSGNALTGGEEDSHWGIGAMRDWVDRGLMTGYPDGSLRPDEPVTRAQFARLINNVFHFGSKADPGFADVPAAAWYYPDVAAAAGAGIIDGFPDGSFKPSDYVRRQDAANMLAVAFKLEASEEELAEAPLAGFKDGDEVHDYAENAFVKLVADGTMNGFPDGTLKPLMPVTRAEAVALLSGLAGEVIQSPGTYKDLEVDGNLIVNIAGVKLENAVVKGNVFVTAGVGKGDVDITDSDIRGTLYVNGGGSESIHIFKSRIGSLIINRLEGTVRVVLGAESEVDEMTVENESVIELEEGAFVKLLTFLESAEGSTLRSKGTIEEILNEAGVEVPKATPTPTPSAPSGPVSTPRPSQSPTPTPTDLPDADDWKLVWSDEFEGPDQDGDEANFDTNGVDLDKWGYQEGTGAQYGLDGWGNNEQQYYRSENIKVDNGVLTITAKDESHEGKPYTSGRLFTEPTFSQTYGKFEASMKLPEGNGLWPAFWMMPKDSEYGGWAASGEIDIMEARGRLPEEVGGTIHFGKNAPNNKMTGKEYHFAEGEDITGFHVYCLEWEPGELRWYVDGELYQTINNWDSWGAGQPAKYAYPAPFDKPFYLIMNLAVGGNFDGGNLPEESDLPAEMVVDYVRVYELDDKPYRTPIEPVIAAEPYPVEYKEPIDGSFVYDPDFQNGFKDVTSGVLDEMNWNFVRGETFGGAGTIGVDEIEEDKYAKAEISNGGNAVHAVQLIQNVTVVKGRWYKLSFDAKSSASRSMAVKIGGGENRGWSVYSDSLDAKLTDDLKGYEMIFQMTSNTDTLARLEFNIGQSTLPVWIGNVRLEETTASDPYSEDAEKEPLLSGNHVYNGSFDLGHMHRMTYWHVDAAEGASVNASVDPEQSWLKANITDSGERVDDIVITQKGIQLLQKDLYSLSFDAWSDADRSITVRFVSGDGNTVYAEPFEAELNTVRSRQTYAFTMPEGVTDRGAQLQVLLGGEAGDVYLDNIELFRKSNLNVDFSKVDIYPLKNGDFYFGLNGWEPFTQVGAANFEMADGAAKIHVTNVGSQGWNVMLNQSNLQLTGGLSYELSFDVRSSIDRDIEVSIENAAYDRRFFSGSLAVTSETKRYSFTFRMPVDESTALKFMMGKTARSVTEAHDVLIDNVTLGVQYPPLLRPATVMPDDTDNNVGSDIGLAYSVNDGWREAISSISVNGTELASDDYSVNDKTISIDASAFTQEGMYTIVIKAEGYADVTVRQQMLATDGNLVLNGNMAQGIANWAIWKENDDYSQITFEDEVTKVKINYHGGIHPEWNIPISWSTQFIQSGIPLQAGKMYELSFNAWSTAPRPIEIELGNYNGNPKVVFNLSTDSGVTHKATLSPSGDVSLALKFLLGNVINGDLNTPNDVHIISIDNVVIREVAIPPLLFADTTENKVGQSMTTTFPDSEAWRAAVQSIRVNETQLSAEQYTLGSGELSLAASLFPSRGSYTITIEAAGYGVNKVTQVVKTAAQNIAQGRTAEASSEKQSADHAFDGDTGTRWESDSADPQWLSVNLGGLYDLEEAVLNWEGAYAKSYVLEVSTAMTPGENDWVDVFSVSNADGGIDTIALDGVDARHIRIWGTERGTIYGYSLWEVEVYGTLIEEDEASAM